MNVREENTVLEQLFLSLHHLSALGQFRSGVRHSDYARVGVLAWYYGIANAASAMTAAQSGSFQEDHAGTAKVWDTEIASRDLVMAPFSWRVSSLVEKNINARSRHTEMEVPESFKVNQSRQQKRWVQRRVICLDQPNGMHGESNKI